MINSVEGCAQVQQSEQRHLSRVSCIHAGYRRKSVVNSCMFSPALYPQDLNIFRKVKFMPGLFRSSYIMIVVYFSDDADDDNLIIILVVAVGGFLCLLIFSFLGVFVARRSKFAGEYYSACNC